MQGWNNIGQLESKTAEITMGGGTCQDFSYEYDNVGRMTSRSNAYLPYGYKPTVESFSYDKMDRLCKSGIAIYPDPYSAMMGTLFSMTYNQNRIATNSKVGTYSYEHPQPHALSGVEPYDDNTISRNDCYLTYTPFNKVKTIEEGSYHYDIRYYPNKTQAVTTLTENGTVISQKYYAGKAYEYDEITDTKYHYIYGEPVAVVIQDGNGNFASYSILTDHLGSIDLIVDKNGNIVDEMSFDAWGNRRDRYDWALGEDPNVVHLIDRGFTGHQHLDVFNLINMGGRVYDPVVQQFLSPDPYVPDMTNTQDLNRYTYARCSPLMYIDPDGEFVWLPIVIGAVIYGTVNTIINHKNGNIQNFGQGLKYFALGAVNGALMGATWSIGIAGIQAVSTMANIGGKIIMAGKAVNAISTISSAMRNQENAWGVMWGKAYVENIQQALLRHTWEGFQTWTGYNVSQVCNLAGITDKVEYWGGATFSTNTNKFVAVSIGNYINVMTSQYSNFDNYILGDQTVMHEYGHTFDSRIWGPAYLLAIGAPSLISAASNKTVQYQGHTIWKHNTRWFERSASRKAKNYFEKYGWKWQEWINPTY